MHHGPSRRRVAGTPQRPAIPERLAFDALPNRRPHLQPLRGDGLAPPDALAVGSTPQALGRLLDDGPQLVDGLFAPGQPMGLGERGDGPIARVTEYPPPSSLRPLALRHGVRSDAPRVVGAQLLRLCPLAWASHRVCEPAMLPPGLCGLLLYIP
ncbi:MAG: hypothetical protein RMK29_13555 [Myxococcales bacterium]|nr:hypothetical protein [Myxococcales bacterium]